VLLSLLGCLFSLAALSFVFHAWGTTAAVIAILMWIGWQRDWHRNDDGGKFTYRPRTTAAARSVSAPTPEQKRVLWASAALGMIITIALMNWSYSVSEAKARGFIASPEEATEVPPATQSKRP
jgi:hypothetical protein